MDWVRLLASPELEEPGIPGWERHRGWEQPRRIEEVRLPLGGNSGWGWEEWESLGRRAGNRRSRIRPTSDPSPSPARSQKEPNDPTLKLLPLLLPTPTTTLTVARCLAGRASAPLTTVEPSPPLRQRRRRTTNEPLSPFLSTSRTTTATLPLSDDSVVQDLPSLLFRPSSKLDPGRSSTAHDPTEEDSEAPRGVSRLLRSWRNSM